jgi:Ca-activated chloride channel family protein
VVRKARLVLVVVLGMALCFSTNRLVSSVSAQDADAPVFTTESSLVVLHVTVKDKQGHYIGGLTKDAFDVFEDGRPQPVAFFTAEDAPVSVGVLIDSSGSMYANRELVVTAATEFVERSNPKDEVFGLTFNETVVPALPEGTRFTSDAHVLRQALAATIKTRGRTALYDAIADGIEYLADGQYERKVLVVVSDGGDNASETTFEQILDKVRASNVVIHAVGLVDPIDPESNLKRLRQLAEASGGIAFRPADAHQVRDALERVALDIRSAYTVGYAPVDTATGGFRHIRAGVRAPNVKGVVVRTRAGYMAPARHGSQSHAE